MTTVNLVIVALVSFWIIYMGWISYCYNLWRGNKRESEMISWLKAKGYIKTRDRKIIDKIKNCVDEFFNDATLFSRRNNGDGVGEHFEIDGVKYWYHIIINKDESKEINNIDIKLKRM